MACALIAERSTPIAILVNRAESLQQWRDRLTRFLGVTDRQLGQLGNRAPERRGVVNLIMMHTARGRGLTGLSDPISHRTGDPTVLAEYGQIPLGQRSGLLNQGCASGEVVAQSQFTVRTCGAGRMNASYRRSRNRQSAATSASVVDARGDATIGRAAFVTVT